MKFGICTDVKLIKEVQQLGFDYLEAKLNALSCLSEEEFEEVVKLVHSSGIAVERCCLLFPKSMVVIGSAYDEAEMVAYLHKAFARMHTLGSSLVVFGSGKSRFIPQGMSYQKAFQELVEVTRVIGQVASEYGIKVAIEPLNRNETNLINSLVEGAALQAMVDLENVGLLADAYHMGTEGESLHTISLVSPLMHAHIATKEGRRFPLCVDQELLGFFSALKESGYDLSVSIEGKSDDWQNDAVRSLATMRSLWEK